MSQPYPNISWAANLVPELSVVVGSLIPHHVISPIIIIITATPSSSPLSSSSSSGGPSRDCRSCRRSGRPPSRAEPDLGGGSAGPGTQCRHRARPVASAVVTWGCDVIRRRPGRSLTGGRQGQDAGRRSAGQAGSVGQTSAAAEGPARVWSLSITLPPSLFLNLFHLFLPSPLSLSLSLSLSPLPPDSLPSPSPHLPPRLRDRRYGL